MEESPAGMTKEGVPAAPDKCAFAAIVNTLFRRGINKDSLPKGTVVIVDGYQAKDGSNRANGRDITLSDGRKHFVGGSTPAEQPK